MYGKNLKIPILEWYFVEIGQIRVDLTEFLPNMLALSIFLAVIGLYAYVMKVCLLSEC